MWIGRLSPQVVSSRPLCQMKARALEFTRFACLLAFQQYRREGIKLGVSSLQDKGSRSSLLLQILYFG